MNDLFSAESNLTPYAAIGLAVTGLYACAAGVFWLIQFLEARKQESEERAAADLAAKTLATPGVSVSVGEDGEVVVTPAAEDEFHPAEPIFADPDVLKERHPGAYARALEILRAQPAT